MTALDRINGEALSVPGLRFWGRRPSWNPNRFSIIAQDERGATELWAEQCSPESAAILGEPSYGGIEMHSPKRIYDWASAEPTFPDCDILGGPCWTDGSALAYSEQALPLILAGDSAGVLRLLADWHASNFGKVAGR